MFKNGIKHIYPKSTIWRRIIHFLVTSYTRKSKFSKICLNLETRITKRHVVTQTSIFVYCPNKKSFAGLFLIESLLQSHLWAVIAKSDHVSSGSSIHIMVPYGRFSSTFDLETWGDWRPDFGVKIFQHVFGWPFVFLDHFQGQSFTNYYTDDKSLMTPLVPDMSLLAAGGLFL